MARPRELTKPLEDFEEVVAKMRKLGVASWHNSPVGDVLLGPEPHRAPKREDADPKKARRVYYAELLGRPVTDAEVEMLP